MKKDMETRDAEPSSPSQSGGDISSKEPGMDRRKFVELTATAALGFTIVPRHVLGGKNFIAPSDKITLGYIGMGTQGIREL